MMIKTATTPKNVYELAQERLRIIFTSLIMSIFPFREVKTAGCY